MGLNNASASAPSNPEVGEPWYDSDNYLYQLYGSSSWLSNFLGLAFKRTRDKTNGPFLHELISHADSITDNTYFTFMNITIPNKDTSAMIIVEYILNSDEGAGYYRTGQMRINISRNTGANTQTDLNHTIAGETTPSSTLATFHSDPTPAKIYQMSGFSDTVSDSFSSPSTIPRGIAWDGTNIYSADGQDDKLYQHSTFSSTISDSFSSPSDSPTGIAWDGTNILSADTTTDKIYQHSTFTNTISDSFSSPSDSPMGLAWDDTHLMSIEYNAGKIYHHSGFSATIQDSFSSPSDQPTGLFWDDESVMSCDSNSDKCYRHSGFSATIQDSFSTPSTTPWGVAYEYTTGDIDSISFRIGSLSGAAGATQTAPLQVKAKAMPTNTLNIRYAARILSGGYQDAESGCEVSLLPV